MWERYMHNCPFNITMNNSAGRNSQIIYLGVRQLADGVIWVHEAAGSSPATQTICYGRKFANFMIVP